MRSNTHLLTSAPLTNACHSSSQKDFILLPPPVDPDVGGACEPGVQEVDAAHRPRPPDRLPQRRVVVEAETLPEPVDGVWGHFILEEERSR